RRVGLALARYDASEMQSLPGCTFCTASSWASRLSGSHSVSPAAQRLNNAFKPRLLRSAKHMADTACHVPRSTTRLGLTWVLGHRSKQCLQSLIKGSLERKPSIVGFRNLACLTSPSAKRKRHSPRFFRPTSKGQTF